MKTKLKLLLPLLLVIFSVSELFTQTIQQKLLLVQNDGVVGQNFIVAVQVKGTSLPAANTLGSATIDVQFDNTKLSYQSADTWAFSSSDGYSRSAANNTTFVRVAVTGGAVGPSNSTVGFDIINSGTYTTWVQLNFHLLSTAGTTALTIASVGNQIGLFENHANNPQTGVINNQTLSAPVNIQDEPLPVELNAFTAKAKGSNVELLWQTKTEINNYGFEIERASFMTSPIQGWAKIGFVPGHGNSNSPKDYSLTDKNPIGGSKFVYRLKQIDNNGKINYSDQVEIELLPDNFALYQNYPNPFNPITNIKFAVPKAGNITLSVYSILGEKIKDLAVGFFEPGIYNVSFDGKDFTSGTYIYRIQAESAAGGFVQIKKMLLVR